MKAAIDRVMITFGMIERMTAEQQDLTRAALATHLRGVDIHDEHLLSVEGLRFLREWAGHPPALFRRPKGEAL